MSAEIIAKLGLDDAKFDRGLQQSESKFKRFVRSLTGANSGGGQGIDPLPPIPQVEQKANGILGLLRKKFSGTDLFKDTIKGLGFGLGAGAIGNGIAEFFSIAADRAKAAAATSAELYQGTLRIIGVIGGPTRQLQLQKREAQDLSTDLEMQKKLVAELNANPLNLITDAGRAAIREAEEGVNILIRRQAELRNQIHQTEIEESRRNDAIYRQGLLQKGLFFIESMHGTEMDKLDAHRLALQREHDELVRQGALPSTLRENENQQEAVDQARQLAARNRKEALEDVQRQSTLTHNLATLELRHASEMEKYEERRRALEEELRVLQERNASPAEIEQAKQRIKALGDEHQIYIRNEREKREDLERTAKLDHELTQAELRDAGDVEKKQIRLNGLRRDYDTLKKRGARESDLEANRNEQRHLANEIKIDQRNAGRQLNNSLVNVGEGIVGRLPGRSFTPRTRGRSERERIADRAAANQARAEEAARNGASPEFVASLAQSAARDFRKVGAQLGQSTSKIDKSTADSLGSPLLKTNQILEDIRKNLTPQAVK